MPPDSLRPPVKGSLPLSHLEPEYLLMKFAHLDQSVGETEFSREFAYLLSIEFNYTILI